VKISTRNHGDIVVLDLAGKLVLGSGDVSLRGAMLDLLEDGARKLLINLESVKTIDSSGLGELIRCQSTAARHGATIKLLNVNLKVYQLLTMSRLIGVFEIFDDEAKAVVSFSEDSD
jgi:anti-sigma B factor antagonist